MEKRITLSRDERKRINEFRKKEVFNLQEQIAALLVRNEIWQKESRSGPEDGQFLTGSQAWERFCHRWHIDTMWPGTDQSLAQFIKTKPVLHHRIRGVEGMTNLDDGSSDPFGEVWTLGLGRTKGNFLYMRIDPWTGIDDIRNNWRRIMGWKRKCFSETFTRKHETFGRDLCWYDLEKSNSDLSRTAKIEVVRKLRDA